MNVFKGLNLLVRFLLELCMLAAIGYWGFKTGSGWVMKVILGIGLPEDCDESFHRLIDALVAGLQPE